jgi:antibiotic biosynthesis monooxygenase (ABM) superfamily enzyme
MVLEQALVRVVVGQEAGFEDSLVAAREVIAKAPGFRSIRVLRGLENPQTHRRLPRFGAVRSMASADRSVLRRRVARRALLTAAGGLSRADEQDSAGGAQRSQRSLDAD